MLFAVSAFASQPEDGLSTQHEDALYAVVRLENASQFLQWIFSKDNLRLFVPLIMKGKPEIEILGTSEFINAVVSASPLRSAAITIGINKSDAKLKNPFVQAIFTFSPEVGDIIRKISEGNAEAIDVAKIFLGDKLQAVFAETMIKVEPEKDNIFRVNNELFMKAVDDMVIFGSSVNEVRRAVKSLGEEESRLLAKTPRKFTEKDFAILHIDYETLAELDDDGEIDDLDARKYFDKPLEVEFAFKSSADKFQLSTALNLSKSLKKEYADKILKQAEELKAVKGGNIDIAHTGGSSSPLAALGTHLDFGTLKEDENWQPFIKRALRNLRVRFGISEEETTNFFTGPFSAVVNDTVTFEGFKIPAVYFTQTGMKDSAEKIFAKLTKSQHFSKVQDGILQLDSSLSPISCLVVNMGESLGINFAELSSFSEKPELKPAFSELMDRESIASMWIDFAGIQSWVNDDNNGVFIALGPIMTFAGYGKYFKAMRDIMTAELSVPSVSVWGSAPEIIHTEFALRDINIENGLFARLIKIYEDFKADKAAKKDSQEESD